MNFKSSARIHALKYQIVQTRQSIVSIIGHDKQYLVRYASQRISSQQGYFARFTIANCNDMLAFYGLQQGGNIAVKRSRITKYIAIL